MVHRLAQFDFTVTFRQKTNYSKVRIKNKVKGQDQIGSKGKKIEQGQDKKKKQGNLKDQDQKEKN